MKNQIFKTMMTEESYKSFTMRDIIALHALSTINRYNYGGDTAPDDIAQEVYEIADAMLKIRKEN